MSTRERMMYGVASQGVTSLTNFLLVIAVARSQTPTLLGEWTLAFAIVTLGTTLGRAALSTPIILTRVDNPARDVSGGVGASLVGGVIAGALTLALGLVGLVTLPIAAALGVAAICAIPQDFLRYTWIARGRPGRALMLDITWLAVQGATTTAYLLGGGTSAVVLSLLWAAGALASVVLGVALDGHVRLSKTATSEFVATHRLDSQRLFGESLANALAANLLPFVVTLVVGLAGAGAFRVAQTFFAPLTTLIAGLTPVVLREISTRIDRGTPTRRIRLTYLVGLTGASLAYGAVVVLLPDKVGEQLAGESWPLATALLVPLALFGCIRPSMTLAMLFLRAHRKFSMLRTAGWLFVGPTLLWSAALGSVFGLSGVGWGQFYDGVVRTSIYAVASARAHHKPPADVD